MLRTILNIPGVSGKHPIQVDEFGNVSLSEGFRQAEAGICNDQLVDAVAIVLGNFSSGFLPESDMPFLAKAYALLLVEVNTRRHFDEMELDYFDTDELMQIAKQKFPQYFAGVSLPKKLAV